MGPWSLAIIAVSLLIWGDDLLKQAAEKNETFGWCVLLGAILYASNAPLWAYIMQTKSLGQIAIMYSSLTLIGLYALGLLRYNETPSNWQLVSLVLALAATITSEW